MMILIISNQKKKNKQKQKNNRCLKYIKNGSDIIMTKVCVKCYNQERFKRYKIQHNYKKRRWGWCDNCGKFSKYLLWTKAPWPRRKRIIKAILDLLFNTRSFFWRLEHGYYKDKYFYD